MDGKRLSDIQELIKRRRYQMMVHSFIYYELNDNIIDDVKWSKWAMELQELQEKHPNDSKAVKDYYDEFVGWDGSTGAFLKFDRATMGRAYMLLRMKQKMS